MTVQSARTTNEELIERLQAVGEDTPEAAAIMGQLWEQNAGLVRLTVHRVTGLNKGEFGFEDMEQQAYFGFRAAVYSYDPAADLAFSTMVVKRIAWELYRYYERDSFTVRVPAFMRRRLKECAETRRRLETETGRNVTNEDALKAMGLSPAVIASTLAAARKLQTASLDSPCRDDADGEGAAMLDIVADGSNMENFVIGQEWQRDLHAVLIEALQDVPDDTRGIISRHYFSGVPLGRMAREYGITKQAVYDREKRAFQSIRAGRYGPELAEFMPSMSEKNKADRQIRKDRAAMARLQLSDTEKELLAL